MSCATAQKKPAPTKAEQVGMLIDLGRASLAEGDPTGALKALMEANEIEDENAVVHHLMAISYYAKKLPDEAIREVKIALKIAPKFSDAENTYGKILLDQGKYEQAASLLKAAAADPLYRESFKPLTSLGILYYRRADLAKSRDYLERAIDSAPDNACIAYYYLGHIDMSQSHLPSAISDYARASKKSCANFGDARVALGMAYERDRQYDQARKTYLDIEKAYPGTKAADQAMERLQYLP
jgi:Tfp pilus assembly protein PilF